jgi:hypothetical protein
LQEHITGRGKGGEALLATAEPPPLRALRTPALPVCALCSHAFSHTGGACPSCILYPVHIASGAEPVCAVSCLHTCFRLVGLQATPCLTASLGPPTPTANTVPLQLLAHWPHAVSLTLQGMGSCTRRSCRCLGSSLCRGAGFGAAGHGECQRGGHENTAPFTLGRPAKL